MFDKLDFILEKYEELSQKVSDPEIINNQPMWQKHMKEMSEMEPIVNKYKEYKKAKSDMAGAKEMLAVSYTHLLIRADKITIILAVFVCNHAHLFAGLEQCVHCCCRIQRSIAENHIRTGSAAEIRTLSCKVSVALLFVHKISADAYYFVISGRTCYLSLIHIYRHPVLSTDTALPCLVFRTALPASSL